MALGAHRCAAAEFSTISDDTVGDIRAVGALELHLGWYPLEYQRAEFSREPHEFFGILARHAHNRRKIKA